MKETNQILEEETIQADGRGRVGLGRKNALYIKRVDEQGNIVLIPSKPVPESQLESLVLLSRAEMESFVSRLENPRPKNAAFEKARAKFKSKHK